MLRWLKKNFVYPGYLKNEKGFSLLSLLVMMMIVTFTIPFFGYALQSVQIDDDHRDLTVHEFYRFIRDDVIRSYDYEIVNNHTLYLYQDHGQRVTIHRYGNLIRRQVENKGHEIYFRGAKEITFERTIHGFKLILSTEEGVTYERNFKFYNES